jgi:flavin-dependent dehydrogenase
MLSNHAESKVDLVAQWRQKHSKGGQSDQHEAQEYEKELRKEKLKKLKKSKKRRKAVNSMAPTEAKVPVDRLLSKLASSHHSVLPAASGVESDDEGDDVSVVSLSILVPEDRLKSVPREPTDGGNKFILLSHLN